VAELFYPMPGIDKGGFGRLCQALLAKQAIRRRRDPNPSESLKLVGGRATAGPHLGDQPRLVLCIVAGQISTPGSTATAAAACVRGLAHRHLPRGVETRSAAGCCLMVARVSPNRHRANRQDEHCLTRSANDAEIAPEE